jgi:hypothetical protein
MLFLSTYSISIYNDSEYERAHSRIRESFEANICTSCPTLVTKVSFPYIFAEILVSVIKWKWSDSVSFLLITRVLHL